MIPNSTLRITLWARPYRRGLSDSVSELLRLIQRQSWEMKSICLRVQPFPPLHVTANYFQKIILFFIFHLKKNRTWGYAFRQRKWEEGRKRNIKERKKYAVREKRLSAASCVTSYQGWSTTPRGAPWWDGTAAFRAQDMPSHWATPASTGKNIINNHIYPAKLKTSTPKLYSFTTHMQ